MSLNTFILLVLGLLFVWIAITFNSLISLLNRTKEAWSDIDVQLKRKYSLIPDLIDIVKGYAKHEKTLFEEISNARAQAMNAKTITDKESADSTVSLNLKGLLAIAENYPSLRASENFAKLQDQLTETENTVAFARRYYNGNVRDLNTKIETFPNNLIAALFHFQKMEFFELDKTDK